MSAKGSLFAPSKSHSEDKSVSVDRKTGMTTNSEKIEINWIHLGMLTITPLLGFIGLATTKLVFPTFVLAILMYLWTGMGITAGYHRLWSHRAYKAHWAVRAFLMLGGAGAFEGSAKWWCRNHRAHHRYTDTEKDPYNATKGFWYSHLGWMLQKQNAHKIGFADISDLNKDPMILWQHKYYAYISIGIGLVLPTLLAGICWGDYWGGYFYAGIWKMVGVHHATFFVNSLAHTWGNKTFSDLHTAFDSVLTAVLTLGEGYHNYHHEFPQDYRNGIKPYHYDPTKWLISFWSFFGLAFDLKYITDEEIAKARVQMKQRQVDRENAQFQYGKHFDQLPELSWNDIRRRNAAGDNLIVIEGVVHDVKTFVHEHPGGRQTLLNFIGTDATGLFVGADGSHSHSKEARRFLNAMRMGLLKETDRGA